MTVYLSQEKSQISASASLVRHFRDFLQSGSLQMPDPYDSWGTTLLNKEEAQSKLKYLIDVAINRKAGIPDAYNSELEGRHQVDEVIREAYRMLRDDPEIPARTGHFSAPMKRLLHRVIEDAKAYQAGQPVKEDNMDATKSGSVAVMPSFSEYGIASKEARSIVPGQGTLPESLKPMQSALSRIASRLNVDMSKSGEELTKSIQEAFARREVSITAPTPVNGPSLA